MSTRLDMTGWKSNLLAIVQGLKFNYTTKWYLHLPESVQEHETLNENERKTWISQLSWKAVKQECVGNTYSSWCDRNSAQGLGKETGGIVNQRKYRYHSIVEIG